MVPVGNPPFWSGVFNPRREFELEGGRRTDCTADVVEMAGPFNSATLDPARYWGALCLFSSERPTEGMLERGWAELACTAVLIPKGGRGARWSCPPRRTDMVVLEEGQLIAVRATVKT